MTSLYFRESTYSREYDTATEIPDDIIRNNTAAARNILDNPAKFPKANLVEIEADFIFLDHECLMRGITPKFLYR
jgi:hypothetical protein